VQALSKLAAHIKTLCQDLSQDVRHAVCTHAMVPLADALGDADGGAARVQVLEDTIELTKDDHIDVRHSALRCLAAVLPGLPPGVRHTTFPAIEPFLQPYGADAQLSTQRVVAELMATLPGTLAPLLPGERGPILDCYRNLSARPDAAVRLACARAFPAVVLAAVAPAQTCTVEGPLADVLLRMAGDGEVRRCPVQRGLARSPCCDPCTLLGDQTAKARLVKGCIACRACSSGTGCFWALSRA
jgi:hypothetical protein